MNVQSNGQDELTLENIWTIFVPLLSSLRGYDVAILKPYTRIFFCSVFLLGVLGHRRLEHLYSNGVWGWGGGGWNGMLGLLGNIYSTCLACRNKNRLEKGQGVAAKKRCCYTTVGFATTASQNGFNTYKLSFHKKINIFQKMTKI